MFTSASPDRRRPRGLACASSNGGGDGYFPGLVCATRAFSVACLATQYRNRHKLPATREGGRGEWASRLKP